MTQAWTPQDIAGISVLIVDDSKEITSLLADVVEAAGGRAVQVNGGRDAMVCLAAGGFDVVVLDMVMPQPDGWDVLRFMRHRPEWLDRTIILTANRYNPQVAKTASECGVARLFKPFLLSDVLGMVHRVAARTRRASVA